MVAISDFVQIYDNSLDGQTCEFLIDLVEQNLGLQETNDKPYYTEFNLTQVRQLSNEVNDIHNQIIQLIYQKRDDYYELFEPKVFPEKHAFEQFKIQKYSPDEIEHLEASVDIIDYETARRYLCFSWFLNSNPAGQYEFLDLFIQPEAGKLVVYPPFWMFPYKKYLPVKEPQYILKTYLHYK